MKKIKIGIHRMHNNKIYNYILPKRLTLKSNPPAYKWLFFYIAIVD